MNFKYSLIFLVFVFFLNNFAYSDTQEIFLLGNQTGAFTVIKNIDENPKINPDIFSTNDSNIRSLSNLNTLEDKIKVYIYLKPEEVDSFQRNFEILAQSGNVISARLTIEQINSLSESPKVAKIDLPVYGEVLNHDVSEGVSISSADEMHSAGFTGNGIKVAVIDNGFLTSNSEIASNIVFTDTCSTFGTMSCLTTDGNSHGTATAEIVVDMAPNVDLYLYATGGAFVGSVDLLDVETAILDAISKDVDIITISLGFASIGGDGTTGFFIDGTSSVAKIVNQAKDNGILVTVSAGNSGNEHWKGTYNLITPAALGVTSPYESFMNFRPSETGLQKICLPVVDFGSGYFFNWSDWDTIPNSNQDYDVFLFDSTMNVQLGQSIGPQNGFQFPEETLFIDTFLAPQLACVVIASFSSTENHLFHLLSFNPITIVREGSISTPADATGALTVGAVDQATDIIETFSSSGPTDDGRLKPEICGSDNTLSHQISGLNPFFGTSAAAPHVAGAAALLLEQNPSLTVDQLRNKLINEAKFNEDYSVNNLCGSNSGVVSLEAAVPAGNSPPTVESAISNVSVFENASDTVIDLGAAFADAEDADNAMTYTITGNTFSGSFTSIGITGTTLTIDYASSGTGSGAITIRATDTGGLFVEDTFTVTVTANTCTPPGSGTWTITTSCTMNSSATAPGNVLVQNNAVLTIPSGITLDINFGSFNLTVKSGSGVLIQSGGKIT